MIRSLWIAKTGMEGQQTKLDTVSNNLANVGTNGFKRAGVVFEDLMYQNLRTAGAASSEESELPTGLQVGLGVRVAASTRSRFDSWSVNLRGAAPLDGQTELQARALLFDDRRTLRFTGADTASSGGDAGSSPITVFQTGDEKLTEMALQALAPRLDSASLFGELAAHRERHRGSLAAAIRSAEQPGLTAERDAALALALPAHLPCQASI